MRLIRVGVIFDQKVGVGGGYHQALNSALMMLKIKNKFVEPIFLTTIKKN